MTDATNVPEPRGVEEAVAREMRRLRRLSLLFTVLLIVPLGLAAYYYVFGRTDQQFMRDEVQRRVEPIAEATRDLRPALDEVKSTTVRVQQQQQVIQDQAARVTTLVSAQEDVRAQVATITEQLPRLDSSLAQLQEVSARVSVISEQIPRLTAAAAQTQELAARVGTLSRDVVALRDRGPAVPREAGGRSLEDLAARVAALGEELRANRARLDSMDGELKAVRMRVERPVIKPPGDGDRPEASPHEQAAPADAGGRGGRGRR